MGVKYDSAWVITNLVNLTGQHETDVGQVPMSLNNLPPNFIRKGDKAYTTFLGKELEQANALPNESGVWYAFGAFSGEADFDPDGSSPITRTADGSSHDGYLTKFNSNYEIDWIVRIRNYGGGTISRPGGQNIATDAYGNVYIVIFKTVNSEIMSINDTTQNLTFLQQGVANESWHLAKIDSAGTVQWTKEYSFSSSPTDSATETRIFNGISCTHDGSRVALFSEINYAESGITLNPGLGAIPNDYDTDAARLGIVVVLDGDDGTTLMQAYNREASSNDRYVEGVVGGSSLKGNPSELIYGASLFGESADAYEFDSGGSSPVTIAAFISNQQTLAAYPKYSLTGIEHVLYHQLGASVGNNQSRVQAGLEIDLNGNSYIVLGAANHGTTSVIQRDSTSISSPTSLNDNRFIFMKRNSVGDEVWNIEWELSTNVNDSQLAGAVYTIRLSPDQNTAYLLFRCSTVAAGTINISGVGITTLVPGSFFVIAVNTSNGQAKWIKQIARGNSSQQIEANHLHVDRISGRIIVGCSIEMDVGTLDFGDGFTFSSPDWGSATGTHAVAWFIEDNDTSASTLNVVRVCEAVDANGAKCGGVGAY